MISKEKLAEIRHEMNLKYGKDLPDSALLNLVTAEYARQTKGPKTRAFYRVEATRRIVAGRRLSVVHASDGKPEESLVEFESRDYAVLECAGHVTLTLIRHGVEGRLGPIEVNYRTVDGTATGNEDYEKVD